MAPEQGGFAEQNRFCPSLPANRRKRCFFRFGAPIPGNQEIGESWAFFSILEGVPEVEKVATFFAKKSEKKCSLSRSKSGTFFTPGGGVPELDSELDSGMVGMGGLGWLGGCPDLVLDLY